MARLSCVGGLIIVEYGLLEEGAVRSFWADELRPEDGAALESTETAVLKCKRLRFSEMSENGECWNAPGDVSVSVTDTGVSLSSDGLEQTFERVEDGGWFHTEPAELKRALALETEGGPTGDWSFTGEVCAAWISLRADGSFQYACKVKAAPVLALTGAWGVDADGKLRVVAEKLGEGTRRWEYTLDWSVSGEELLLTDASREALLPEEGEHSFLPAGAGWAFPDGLFSSGEVPVEEYYSESGSFTDPESGTWSYDFRIPQITDDTEAAREINGEIRDRYERYAVSDLEGLEGGSGMAHAEIGWYACRYSAPALEQDILSLIVFAEDIYNAREYSVFCYDPTSGERYYGNDGLLQTLGISEADALEATRRAAWECFVDGNSALPEERRKESFYTDALARTVSNEYVRDGAMLYIDDAGRLTAIVPVASLAGADWYYRVLPLAVEEQGAYGEERAPEDGAATDMLLADQSVQESGIIEGMSTMSAGETVLVAGENCAVVYAGTNHPESFVREYSFAVSSGGAIYRYDVLADEWQPVNTLAGIYEKWAENVLFAVFTDPNDPEYWYACEGEEGLGKVMLIPMRSGASIRVERLEYDAANDSFAVLETVEIIYPSVRGQGFCLDIQPAETIPVYRIVAEYGDLAAEWYATYDGSGEHGATYVIGTDARAVG